MPAATRQLLEARDGFATSVQRTRLAVHFDSALGVEHSRLCVADEVRRLHGVQTEIRPVRLVETSRSRITVAEGFGRDCFIAADRGGQSGERAQDPTDFYVELLVFHLERAYLHSAHSSDLMPEFALTA